MIDRLPPVEIDDVTVRRLRQRVLERVAADWNGGTPPRGPRWWRRAVPVLLVLGIGAGASAVYVHSTRRPAEEGLAAAFAITSDDHSAIRWSRHEQAGVQRIDLNEGRFRVQIRNHDPSRPVIIHLPDGRIDDLGTTFHVTVSDSRTLRVAVDEGLVTLRLVEAQPSVLGAGDTWERSAAAPDAPDVRAPVPAEAQPEPRLHSALPLPSHPPTARNPRRSYAAAALVAGATDHGVAAEDAAAEDAAYLKIIRLLRTSKREEARAAGREYLRRFPDGFRRDEIGAVAR